MNIESRIEFLSANHQGESLAQIKQRIADLGLRPIYPLINIAGTNGKGSVTHGLSYCLRRTPYKVGRFTSPHLFRYNERIAIDDTPVDEKSLHLSLDSLELAISDNQMTYYQWTFLLALAVFKSQEIDLGLFEIGLGGRLDCGNALDPEIAVLTSVDLDHTEILGETRGAIALEKAAIGRRGKVFVSGEADPPGSLLTYVAEQGFVYSQIDIDFQSVAGTTIHPVNAGIVCEVLKHLSTRLDMSRIKTSDLAQMPILGRQQTHHAFCELILDVAHNPAAVKRLCGMIQERPKAGRVHAIFSSRPVKDIEQMIEIARPYVDEWHIAPIANQSSILDRVLTQLTRSNTNLYPSLRRAYEGAKERCQKEDLLVCFGSFQVVAEISKQLQ